MEQRLRLTQTLQEGTERFTFNYRWIRFFFTPDISSENYNVVELQRRAVWVGLALLFQSLTIITPTFALTPALERQWYLPLMELCSGLLPFGLTIGGFYALWMAIKPISRCQQMDLAHQHGGRAQRMALMRTFILLAIGCVVAGITIVQCFLTPIYSNDGTSLDANAAHLLLEGKNPYTSSNILDVARSFGIQPSWTTPLREGQFAGKLDYPSGIDFRSTFDTALKAGVAPEFESKVSYPALSFLTLVPLTFLKMNNIIPFYLIIYLILVWVGWKVTRKELRPWIVLLALANVPMLSAVMAGSLDILYILLVVLAWLFRDKRWLSVLFLGLAIASKQIAWFFVPFYLLLIWRNQGLREAIVRLILAGALALAINLPFIIWNPGAWLSGVLAPMSDPMFPLGIGLINLSSYHLLPYLPNWVYTLLEGAVMATMLAIYWRLCKVCPEIALLLAVLPLFFAWRSLPSYFSCTAFPIFLLMQARFKPKVIIRNG